MKNVGMLTRLLTLIGVQQKELHFLCLFLVSSYICKGLQ